MSLAQRLIIAAARRWPADLRDDLAREWLAELAHTRHKLAFAASLALSPAVEEEGEEPVTWAQRTAGWGRALAVPAALTLLAAALFNVAHLAQDRFGAVAGGGALVVAAAVMVAAGRGTTVSRVLLLGAALYAFLLAGNQVAVMPFMGWIDVGPAVLAWTALTAVTVLVGRRLRARPVLAALATIGGTVLTLDVAAAAGSLHAATVLGVRAESAPWWLPLSLLPGPVRDLFPLPVSEVLLGNASAMVGPLTLCSVAVVAGLLRRSPGPARAGRRSRDTVGTVALGVTTGLGGLAVGEVLRRSGGAAGFTLDRLMDNSVVFGFGFLAHPAGRAAVALLIGLLVVHLGTERRRVS